MAVRNAATVTPAKSSDAVERLPKRDRPSRYVNATASRPPRNAVRGSRFDEAPWPWNTMTSVAPSPAPEATPSR
jgi:hypothetical protein